MMGIDIQMLRAKMIYNRRTHQNIADALKMERGTFERRLRKGDFRIGEIHTLMNVIPLSESDVKEIFFKKE